MRIRSTVRRLAAPLTAGAVAVAGLTAFSAAPAQAVDTYSTVTTLKINPAKGFYGKYTSVTGATEYNEGAGPISVYGGTASLQRMLPGGTWTTIATDTSPGFLWFPAVDKFQQNSAYRVYYAGGASGSKAWQPSYSNTVVMSVGRNWTLGRGKSLRHGYRFKGKFAPKDTFKATVLKKVGKKWKKFKKVKVKKGKLNVVLPGKRGKGQKYRITTPSNRKFIATFVPVTIRTYYWRTANGAATPFTAEVGTSVLR